MVSPVRLELEPLVFTSALEELSAVMVARISTKADLRASPDWAA